MSNNPTVFISYSHQGNEYESKMLEFANRLRTEGIDANIDLYVEAPAEGWPRWMENQINNSEFVLVVSSKSYYEKCSSDNKGKGVSWEVNIVYQHIYGSTTTNTKFIPVIFKEEEEEYILTPLKSFTYYNIGTKEGYEKLYWRLRGVSKIQKPSLGNLRPLPPKEQKTMFFSTPINLEKWDSAKWRGVLFLFSQESVPVLGLLYQNYAAAKSIFSDWRKIIKDNCADNFIKVDFITPPFPRDCWVYTDRERNYGKGYFVHIGPNIKESFNRAKTFELHQDRLFLTTLSRFQWMDEFKGSTYRDLFQHITGEGSGYLLMPIGVRDIKKPIEESNLIIDFNYAIRMKNVSFTAGVELEENDMCKVVLYKE